MLVDVVEFFVSFNDPHFFWELHHNALNDFNDVWCVVPDPTWQFYKSSLTPFHIYFGNDEYIHDQGEHTLAKAVHLKPKADGKPSTVNDSSDTDTGYTAELRLPWLGLGAPQAAGPGPWKMAGEMLQVLSVVQDGDLPQKYHHSSPIRTPGGFFHTSYDSWPVYKCVSPKPAPLKTFRSNRSSPGLSPFGDETPGFHSLKKLIPENPRQQSLCGSEG